MRVDELEREEEILADRAPEAELQQRLKRDLRVGCVDMS